MEIAFPLRLGPYEVSLPVLSRFRLDGGAMFGTVPRVLWERKEEPDALNRVALVARVLHLQDGQNSLIVDAGLGDSFGEREVEMYAVESTEESELPFAWESLTHVVLTHLHFDHCGGLTERECGDPDGSRSLRAPNAKILIQRSNWERASQPGARERASYLPEDVRAIAEAQLVLLEGEAEILPGVRVHRSDGHTMGLQWVTVSAGGDTLAFPSDLVPTSNHLHLPYVMGYDMSVESLLPEKEDFLRRAVAGRWLVVFAHDRRIQAARLHIDEKGRFAIQEIVNT